MDEAVQPLYLGIDGGGTRVRAVLVDAKGREVGRGNAGTANLATVGIKGAVASITQAVDEALAQAGATLPVAGVVCGLAGVDRPADRVALAPHLAFLSPSLHLTNDAELGLEATPDGTGVCVISGTGSIALGRDASGNTARAGGWGHAFGDEGSGWDIGRLALKAVSKAYDGRGPATSMEAEILAAWGLDNAPEIIGKIYPDPQPPIMAELAGIVFDQAAAGDGVAQGIVADVAVELAEQVLAVARRLDFPGLLQLVLTGGVLRYQQVLRDAVISNIEKERRIGLRVILSDAALAAAQGIAKRAEAAK